MEMPATQAVTGLPELTKRTASVLQVAQRFSALGERLVVLVDFEERARLNAVVSLCVRRFKDVNQQLQEELAMTSTAVAFYPEKEAPTSKVAAKTDP